MNRRKFVAMASALAIFASVSGMAFAEERGTKEEATALVEKALAHIKKVGAAQAYKDFSQKDNPEWHVKDIYVFGYDFNGVNLCHGVNPAIVGKDLSDLKSADGQLLIRNMITLVKEKGSGWISYDWSHPQTKKVEPKQSFLKRVPGSDALVGAGVYR